MYVYSTNVWGGHFINAKFANVLFSVSKIKPGTVRALWGKINYFLPWTGKINVIVSKLKHILCEIRQNEASATSAKQTLISYFSLCTLLMFYLISGCQHQLYDDFKTLPKLSHVTLSCSNFISSILFMGKLWETESRLKNINFLWPLFPAGTGKGLTVHRWEVQVTYTKLLRKYVAG